MAWKAAENRLGQTLIDGVDTAQKVPLGTIIRGTHTTYGQGEFIYLKGTTSTAIGSIVNYDDSFASALDTTATAGPSRPLAIAMAAVDAATKFGWYQIAGMATAKKANSVSFADGAGLGAGSGLAVAVATGSVIQSAIVAAVASAKSDVTSVLVCINRPHDASDVS